MKGATSTALYSYSEIVLIVNAPPSGGLISSAPLTGAPLTTSFALLTTGWSDDPSDYPLTYDFVYAITTSLSSIKARSTSKVNSRDSARTAMCQAIINVANSSNPSSQLMETLVNTLLVSYSPTEVVSPEGTTDPVIIVSLNIRLTALRNAVSSMILSSFAPPPTDLDPNTPLPNGSNETFPECRMYNGFTYVPCNGCNISTYNNYNVTYGCSSVDELCGGSTGRRLDTMSDMESETTGYFQHMTESLFANRQLQTISGDDDGTWDRIDHDQMIYAQADREKAAHDKAREMIENYNNAASKKDDKFKFTTALFEKHDYFTMFSSGSISENRTVRWANVCSSVMLALMLDTLFFGLFYEDKGT
eukprot:gene47469-biopygen31177